MFYTSATYFNIKTFVIDYSNAKKELITLFYNKQDPSIIANNI